MSASASASYFVAFQSAKRSELLSRSLWLTPLLGCMA